jgi:hypothetical protein
MAAARLLPLLRRRLAAVIADSPAPASRGDPLFSVSLACEIQGVGFL